MNHRFKPHHLAFLFGAAIGTAVTPASAASSVRDELTAEAQRDWDAARELYEARDFRSALVHYERAFELSKNPRVLFNVGVCWKELTQYALAIGVWERALLLKSQLSAEEAQKFEYAIAASRPFVASMRVETDQVGALLSIDGYEVGTTPFVEPVAINVGHRKLSLSKPGFVTTEQSVDVVQGRQASVALKLQPLLKTGNVSLSVAGDVKAMLFLDGRELGPAPYTGEVPAGPHTFEARAPGYVTTTQTTEVRYQETLRVVLALAKARNEGKLRVMTQPVDAQIHIDGSYKGAGTWEGLLPPGGHQLKVLRPEYQEYSQEISLSPAQERSVQVKLDKQPAWVWWTVGVASVVGGGTLAAILLSRQSDGAPVHGTLDTVSP
jgi:tetratricopeptide (TPR) repeat protein